MRSPTFCLTSPAQTRPPKKARNSASSGPTQFCAATSRSQAMDLSTGEIELMKNVTKLEKKGAISGEEAIKRRQDLVLKFAKKFEGETVRVFQRPSGKIAQMWTQVGNVFETLGQPFVERAPEMAASFKKIAVEAEPVARELAKMTGEALKNFAKWLEEGGASTIVKNLGHIVTGLKGIEEWLNKINDAATKHDSIWEWLQKVGKPGAQKKLPGSPLAATGRSAHGRRSRPALP